MDLTPETGKKKHKLSLYWPVQNQFPTIQQAWDFLVQRTKLNLSSAEQQYLNSIIICPLHREKLGLGWRRGFTTRCRVPMFFCSVFSEPRSNINDNNNNYVQWETKTPLPIQTLCLL